MNDEHKQRLRDEHEDAALELLMNEYAEIEGEALWREFQAAQAAGSPDSPDREDGKSGRGCNGPGRRIDFLQCVGKEFRRVAVLFLVLVCLLSPLVMSVEAFKLPVLNYFVALERKFSGFNFGNNEYLTQEQQELVDLVLNTPLPAEYHIEAQNVSSHGRIRVIFINNNEETMKISIYPSEGQLNIDTEDVEQITMNIYEYEAVYLLKNGHRLMWLDPERELIFDLYATELEVKDFWKYAYILIEKLSQ